MASRSTPIGTRGAALLICVPVALAGCDVLSSDSDPEAASAAMQEAYDSFSAGYRQLDAGSVASLYTEQALYLPPDGDIVSGRAAIADRFGRFFDSVSERGDQVRISFSSVDRSVDGRLAYDIGYYELEVASSQQIRASRGKFATIWKRTEEGWRIHVDSYSDAPPPSDAVASSEQAAHALHHDGGEASPYASFVDRRIKALSPDEIETLLAGDGMGLALAAELNGYPGPRHVLDLADRLDLDGGQQRRVTEIFQRMKRDAEDLGARIVRAEEELDRAFVSGSLSRAELSERLDGIGQLNAELRSVHLAAHLDMLDALRADQVRRYQHLRGYVSVRQ